MPTQLLSVASGASRSSTVTVAAGDEVSFLLTKAPGANWPKNARVNVDMIGSNGAPQTIAVLKPGPGTVGCQVSAQEASCTYSVYRPEDAGAVGCDRIGGTV